MRADRKHAFRSYRALACASPILLVALLAGCGGSTGDTTTTDRRVPSDVSGGAGTMPPLNTNGNAYINVAANAYGRSPGYSDAECLEIGSKFDVIVGMDGSSCQNRTLIKNNYPNAILLTYTNSSNCTAGDDLCNYLERLDAPENYFLSFATNSVQEINGKQFNRGAGQRVCSYDWGCEQSPGKGTRWTTDYASSASRSVLVNYFSNPLRLPRIRTVGSLTTMTAPAPTLAPWSAAHWSTPSREPTSPATRSWRLPVTP